MGMSDRFQGGKFVVRKLNIFPKAVSASNFSPNRKGEHLDFFLTLYRSFNDIVIEGQIWPLGCLRGRRYCFKAISILSAWQPAGEKLMVGGRGHLAIR
jgi:hypothetical protein